MKKTTAKRITTAILAVSTIASSALLFAGCGEKKNSDTKSESGTVPVEETTEELVPPTPTEATDPNAITFDDGVFDFASVKINRTCRLSFLVFKIEFTHK